MALHHVVMCASHAPYPPFLKIYVYGCFASIFVCAPCVCLMPTEFRIGVTGGHKPLCGWWELNLGPLPGQQVLLSAEPSLQQPSSFFFWVFYCLKLSLYRVTLNSPFECLLRECVPHVGTCSLLSLSTLLSTVLVFGFFFPFVSFGNDFIVGCRKWPCTSEP